MAFRAKFDESHSGSGVADENVVVNERNVGQANVGAGRPLFDVAKLPLPDPVLEAYESDRSQQQPEKV